MKTKPKFGERWMYKGYGIEEIVEVIEYNNYNKDTWKIKLMYHSLYPLSAGSFGTRVFIGNNWKRLKNQDKIQ